MAKFTENLSPGKTYQVEVKTVSGSVASWPATGNVTTRPLPVQNLRLLTVNIETGEVRLEWEPHPESQQDSYRIETFNSTLERNSSSVVVFDNKFSIKDLQPGSNYSIRVASLSNNMESTAVVLPVFINTTKFNNATNSTDIDIKMY